MRSDSIRMAMLSINTTFQLRGLATLALLLLSCPRLILQAVVARLLQADHILQIELQAMAFTQILKN